MTAKRNLVWALVAFATGAAVSAGTTWLVSKKYFEAQYEAQIAQQSEQAREFVGSEGQAQSNEAQEERANLATFMYKSFLAVQCGFRDSDWLRRVELSNVSQFVGFFEAEHRFQADTYNMYSTTLSQDEIVWPLGLNRSHGLDSIENLVGGEVLTKAELQRGDCVALSDSSFLTQADASLPDDVSPPPWFSR